MGAEREPRLVVVARLSEYNKKDVKKKNNNRLMCHNYESCQKGVWKVSMMPTVQDPEIKVLKRKWRRISPPSSDG